nr:PREDICTED: uncharacterized protein LOC103562646 [Equus przewalskii]
MQKCNRRSVSSVCRIQQDSQLVCDFQILELHTRVRVFRHSRSQIPSPRAPLVPERAATTAAGNTREGTRVRIRRVLDPAPATTPTPKPRLPPPCPLLSPPAPLPRGPASYPRAGVSGQRGAGAERGAAACWSAGTAGLGARAALRGTARARLPVHSSFLELSISASLGPNAAGDPVRICRRKECHEKGTEKETSLLVKGEFSHPVGGCFMIGREVPGWLKRLNFYSWTDEADK